MITKTIDQLRVSVSLPLVYPPSGVLAGMRSAACMTAKTASGGKRGTRAFDSGVNHCNRLQLKGFAFFRGLCLVVAGLGSSPTFSRI